MKYYFLALGTLVAVCVGCSAAGTRDGSKIYDDDDDFVAPPAAMLQRPGPMVDGPGPGVLPLAGAARMPAFLPQITQVRFVEPSGMKIGWQSAAGFTDAQLTAPARYDFRQGATYRLKVWGIPRRESLTLYPTLQLYPSHPNTAGYLDHNSLPIEISNADLDQVESNNFVTKVIYLPDPKFQDLAIADVDVLVSTQLPPGADAVAEADRMGTIMGVLRIGNKDYESSGAAAAAAGIQPVAYQADGTKVAVNGPPVPVSMMPAGSGMLNVPGEMIVGQHAPPGLPPMHPVAGMGTIPPWGMPRVGTPIGLPGPAHLPLGGSAGLRSVTNRNLTKMDIPKPVPHLLIDAKHEPGYKLPKPVRHIQYSETHPHYKRDQLSIPMNAGGGFPMMGAPGGYPVAAPLPR